jgi:hypothetical protein
LKAQAKLRLQLRNPGVLSPNTQQGPHLSKTLRSSEHWRWRFWANWAFQDAASLRRQFLSGAVSSDSEPAGRGPGGLISRHVYNVLWQVACKKGEGVPALPDPYHAHTDSPQAAPMLCSMGMAAISCSSALYLRSSASNASMLGLVPMKAS